MTGCLLLHPAAQAATHRAALVIQHGSSWPGPRVVWRCVEFGQEAISGLALLELAGVNSGQPPQVYDWGAGATTVCQINGEPRQIPERCFGPTSGPNWSDWQATAAGWVPRSTGVAGYSVYDGDLEGWTYSVGYGSRPPSTTFAQVCPPAAPVAAASSAAPAPTVAPARPATAVVASPTARTTTTAAPTPSLEALLTTTSPSPQVTMASASSTAGGPRPPGSALPTLLFGSAALALLGLLAWNFRRHAP